MRVLGVDFDLKCGNKNGSMAVCTLDNRNGSNRVVDLHIGQTNADVDTIAKTLISIFEVNNCDYIAFNGGGILTPVSNKIKETLGDKVKDNFFNMKDVHDMIVMLKNGNVLKRVGLELKTVSKNGGLLAFYIDGYEDFELSMVYSIALANRVLNIESLNENKESFFERLNKIDDTIKELENKLNSLDSNILK